MRLSDARPFRPSVRPIRSPYSAAAGLLLWARWPADVDRLLHGRAAERRTSAMGAVSLCQPKLNADLLFS